MVTHGAQPINPRPTATNVPTRALPYIAVRDNRNQLVFGKGRRGLGTLVCGFRFATASATVEETAARRFTGADIR